MDDEIKSYLDKECTRLVKKIYANKLDIIEITHVRAIIYPDVVMFLTGVVYGKIENYFFGIHIDKSTVEKKRLHVEWLTYWREKYPLLIGELQSIFPQ